MTRTRRSSITINLTLDEEHKKHPERCAETRKNTQRKTQGEEALRFFDVDWILTDPIYILLSNTKRQYRA